MGETSIFLTLDAISGYLQIQIHTNAPLEDRTQDQPSRLSANNAVWAP